MLARAALCALACARTYVTLRAPGVVSMRVMINIILYSMKHSDDIITLLRINIILYSMIHSNDVTILRIYILELA